MNVNYDYQGEFGEAEVTFKIRLLDASTWQYKISGDPNTYTILEDTNGNPITTVSFIKEIGDYTITATAHDSTGKPIVVKESQDQRFFQVLSPTPTPTPEKTPTSTPTLTPSPTQTPFNCECTPETHEKVEIVTSNQTVGSFKFQAFTLGSEIGITADQFITEGVATFISLDTIDGNTLGFITCSKLQPNGAKIFVKDGNSGLCYEGIADDSNKQDTTYNVIMTLKSLPGDCQPTPTPEPPECCNGLNETTNVDSEINEHNYVSGTVAMVSGKMCWNTFTEKADVGESFKCPIETTDWSQGGFIINVQGKLNESNRKFRFESTSGDCYEALLLDSNDGFNIFRKVN